MLSVSKLHTRDIHVTFRDNKYFLISRDCLLAVLVAYPCVSLDAIPGLAYPLVIQKEVHASVCDDPGSPVVWHLRAMRDTVSIL